MVDMLRSCTAICTTSTGSPVDKSLAWKREGSRMLFFYLSMVKVDRRGYLNNFKVSNSIPQPVVTESISLSGSSLLASTICSESGLAYREEVCPPSRIQEDQFIENGCMSKLLPMVTPLIELEPSVEARDRPLSRKIERDFNLSKGSLHFLEERDEELLSKRILILSRSNKVRSALEMFASMEASGLRPNAHACNSLISSLLRKGSLDDALKVFEIMTKKEMVSGHTYSLILKAVASNHGCDSALEMFKALQEDGVCKKFFDVIVYNTMISICSKARNWVETERIWRILKQDGLGGTKLSYELLISTFVQCGQSELAVDAYIQMIQNGHEPSEDTLKAVLASCTKDGKWDLGLSIFKKMLDSGIKPTIISFNSMIHCLGKAGKDDLAFEIYDLLKASGHSPDGYTWNSLLCALYGSKRYSDALQLFEDIRTEGGSALNVHLYNTALRSCQKLGLWERSLQLLWEMERRGFQMSTCSYNHAISACQVAREPKVALEIYRHMIQKKCVPDTFTYLSLIRSCIWGSLWSEIEEFLECVTPNSSFYNALIHGLCLRGKITLAKKLYNKMCSIGLKPDGKTRALMLQHLSNEIRKR